MVIYLAEINLFLAADGSTRPLYREESADEIEAIITEESSSNSQTSISAVDKNSTQSKYEESNTKVSKQNQMEFPSPKR